MVRSPLGTPRCGLELSPRLVPCGEWGAVGHRLPVVELGRARSGVGRVRLGLGLRAAPAAESCVKTYRNVGEAGGIVLSGSDQGKVMAEHFYYPATAMYCRPCRTWRPGGPLGHVHGKGSAQHCRSRLRVSQGRGTSGRAHAPPRHGGV